MGILNNLLVRIRGDSTHLEGTLKKTQGTITTWSKKILGLLGIAFGVREIINFGKEATKLAATAEGIAKGFNQIAKPGLLDELREATKGTVTDMQLMSRAVQASNFQIPLNSLAKLLEFASARAVQTGQSVDYLVDSIVLGIGRKSPLILDNLGISAVRLRELLKGTGTEVKTVGDVAAAVGKIAAEELDKMGGMAETASVKMQRLGTAWTNLKTIIGEKIAGSQLFQDIIEGLTILIGKIAPESSRFTGMSQEQLIIEKQRLETAIDTGYAYLGQLSTKEAEVTFWDEIFGRLRDIKRTTKETEITITKYEEDIAEINRLLSYVPPPGSTGEILTRVKAPAIAPIGGLKYPVLSKLKGKEKVTGLPEIAGIQEFNTQLEREATKLEMILTDMRDMAMEYGAEIVQALGEALGGGKVKDIGRNLLLSMANFLSQLGKMLIAFGLGIDAFVKSAATMNPFLAIAAGAAMLLVAGAIKGAISSAGKTVASGAQGGGYGSTSTMQTVKVVVEGTIKGKDIGIALRRNI